MVYIKSLSSGSIVNLAMAEEICVEGTSIVVRTSGRSYIVARYRSESEAEEVFKELIDDLNDLQALPFADGMFTVYEFRG